MNCQIEVMKQLNIVRRSLQVILDQFYLSSINEDINQKSPDRQTIYDLLQDYDRILSNLEDQYKINSNIFETNFIEPINLSENGMKDSLNKILYPTYYNEPQTQLNTTIKKQKVQKHILYNTIQAQQKINDLVEKGLSFQQISNLLKISYKSVSKLWRQFGNGNKSAGRRVSYPQMEKQLYEKIRDLKTQFIQIKQIQRLGMILVNKQQFKASKGWAKNFIRRYKLQEKYKIR